jgi:hypothetical protein
MNNIYFLVARLYYIIINKAIQQIIDINGYENEGKVKSSENMHVWNIYVGNFVEELCLHLQELFIFDIIYSAINIKY